MRSQRLWIAVFYGTVGTIVLAWATEPAAPQQDSQLPVRVVDTHPNPIVPIQPHFFTHLKMRKGTSAILVSGRGISRFALGDPQVVALTVLTERELVVNAKGEGRTNLVIWEDQTKDSSLPIPFWVEVSAPPKLEEVPPPAPTAPKVTPEQVQQLLEKALKDFRVQATVLALPDGTVSAILRGEVDTPEEGKAIENIAQMVTPKVVSLLKVRHVPPPPLSPEAQKSRHIEEAIGMPGVKVTIAEDKIILHGQVASLFDRTMAEERAKPFGTVINRLEVAEPKVRQFTAEVQVLEISRSALQKLGVEIGKVQLPTGVGVPGAPGAPGAGGIFVVTPGEALFGEPATPDLPMGRVTALGAQVKALIQKGQARLLANPQQRTLEGADATFLVGGLVPIPVFGFFGIGAGAAAPGAASVIFFPFGITLTLHPEATPQGEIFLQMRVEVTSPDFGLATQVLGTTVPGFRFRGLDDVKLLLKDGSTIVISGLIQDEVREQVNRFPILSKIPVLGELFKSREFVRQQTELVILVTIHAEETPVSSSALKLMQTYQKRPVLPRPTFVVPSIGGGLGGGFGAGIGATGGAGSPTAPSP